MMKKGLFGFGTPMMSRNNSSTSIESTDLSSRPPSIIVDKVTTESLYAVGSARPTPAPRAERDSIISKLLTEYETQSSATSPPTTPLFGTTHTARATLASHLINLHLIPQIINDYPASRAGEMLTKIGNVNTAYAKWPTLEQNLQSEGMKERILASISSDMYDEMMIVLEGIDDVCGTFWGKAGLVKAGYAAMRAGPGDVVAAPDDIIGVKGVAIRQKCIDELKRLEKLEWEMRFGMWKDYEGEGVDPIDWMESQKQMRYKDIARISNRNHTVELVKKCMGDYDIEKGEGEEGEAFAGVVEKAMEAGSAYGQRGLIAH